MSDENVEIVRRATEAAIRRPKPDSVTVRGGKVIRTESFSSPEQALEAAGLRE